MKAFGLSLVIRKEMGVRTEVYSEDYDETYYLKVTSALEAEQLHKLQNLAEVNGWDLLYRAFRPDDRYLAIVPSEVGEEVPL